jgi:hypothetical protein
MLFTINGIFNSNISLSGRVRNLCDSSRGRGRAHARRGPLGLAGAFQQKDTVSIEIHVFSISSSDRNKTTHVEPFGAQGEPNPLIFRDSPCLMYANRRSLHRCARWSWMGDNRGKSLNTRSGAEVQQQQCIGSNQPVPRALVSLLSHSVSPFPFSIGKRALPQNLGDALLGKETAVGPPGSGRTGARSVSSGPSLVAVDGEEKRRRIISFSIHVRAFELPQSARASCGQLRGCALLLPRLAQVCQ